MDCSPPRLLCPWVFSRQEYWNGLSCPPKGDLSNLGLKLRFPSLQADSSLTELPGKPMNSGVGSLSLLQEIFLTQQLNRGLLHDQVSFSYSKGHRPSEILLTNAGTRKNIIHLDQDQPPWFYEQAFVKCSVYTNSILRMNRGDRQLFELNSREYS